MPLAGQEVPPGTTSALVELPHTPAELRLRGTDDGALLYRLVPEALSVSSVTTIVVRDAEASARASRGIGAIALETRLEPSDPAQALVRLVQGGMTSDPDEAGAGRTVYRLVPAGDSPGGVEVAFEAIGFDIDPVTPYRDVPAGDYRLEGVAADGTGTTLSPRPVSIAPGRVHTFVVVDTDTVIDVIDSIDTR